MAGMLTHVMQHNEELVFWEAVGIGRLFQDGVEAAAGTVFHYQNLVSSVGLQNQKQELVHTQIYTYICTYTQIYTVIVLHYTTIGTFEKKHRETVRKCNICVIHTHIFMDGAEQVNQVLDRVALHEETLGLEPTYLLLHCEQLNDILVVELL